MTLTKQKAEAIVDELFASGTRRIGRLKKSLARSPRELVPGSLFSFGMRSDDFGQVDVQLFAGLGDLGGALWRQQLRTLRAISAVNEPGLPRILEGDTDPGFDVAFVVSEGSDQTLDDEGVLEYLTATANRLIAFKQFRLLLAALRRLHGRRLMHRTVSPSSIDVTFADPSSAETIGLRLARFEMSAFIENVLRAGEPADIVRLWHASDRWSDRELQFMPPERLAALQPRLGWDALQDIRSDVFGLGVLAYCLFVRQGWLRPEESIRREMLTSPAAIREALELRRRNLQSAEVRRRVPGELLDLIDRMIHFDRANRPTAFQAEEELRMAAAAIESGWSEEHDVPEPFARIASIAPSYFKQTFYDTSEEYRVVSHSPDTDTGRRELRQYIERDLAEAHVFFEASGYAVYSGDDRDQRHSGAKYVLVGQTWLYFSALFRANPLIKASAVDEVLHISFVLQRSRALARRLLEEASLTRVGPITVSYMKDAVHAAAGRPTWKPLLRKAEQASGVKRSKLRLKYEAAFEFVLELGAAQIASRLYAYQFQVDDNRLLLTPAKDVDDARRRQWTLLWALDRANRIPSFADFFSSLEPESGKDIELRLWPRLADDRGTRGSRSASIVVTLQTRMGNSLLVSLPPGKTVTDVPVSGWASPLDDDGSAVVQARQRQAVAEILEREELLGQIEIPSAVVTEPSGDDRFKDNLKGQAPQVLDAMTSTWPLYAVDGPPGTGKTLLTARAVSSTLHRDRSHRILVSAQSHDSLDNMAERIVATLKDYSLTDRVRCVRVTTPGSENRVSDAMMTYLASVQTEALVQAIQNRATQHRRERDLAPALLQIALRWAAESQRSIGELEDRLRRGANIVFATCGSATPEKLAVAGDDQLFDWAIIEEAARAWLPELALPLVRAARWTLIGDYRQLPPFGSDELQRVLDVCESSQHEDEDLKALLGHRDAIYKATSTFKSLFADIGGGERPTQGAKKPWGKLRRQFRMDRPIGELVSRAYYHGELECGTNREVAYALYAPAWLKNESLVWLDTGGLHGEEEPRWSNPVEARVAATIARDMRVMGDAAADVVLLSPYRAQLKLLERQIGVDRNIPIKTIDSFQGKEADVVIASLVRENSETNTLSRIGHLDYAARVNVMCSRAKRLLVLVGNYRHFKDTRSTPWLAFFEHFSALGTVIPASKFFDPQGQRLQW